MEYKERANDVDKETTLIALLGVAFSMCRTFANIRFSQSSELSGTNLLQCTVIHDRSIQHKPIIRNMILFSRV